MKCRVSACGVSPFCCYPTRFAYDYYSKINPQLSYQVTFPVLFFFLDFPQLPPLEQAVNNNNQPRQQEPNGEWGDVSAKGKKFKRTSGPRSIDPYASDESWFWPITIAIAIFLPVMFCLCGLS